MGSLAAGGVELYSKRWWNAPPKIWWQFTVEATKNKSDLQMLLLLLKCYTLTCFCSFTYLETIQKWMYFGLLFHLKLILSHSIVLQKCAFKFSFFLSWLCRQHHAMFFCFGQGPGLSECKQISRHLVDTNICHEALLHDCSAHKTITITTGGAQCNYTLS